MKVFFQVHTAHVHHVHYIFRVVNPRVWSEMVPGSDVDELTLKLLEYK